MTQATPRVIFHNRRSIMFSEDLQSLCSLEEVLHKSIDHLPRGFRISEDISDKLLSQIVIFDVKHLIKVNLHLRSSSLFSVQSLKLVIHPHLHPEPLPDECHLVSSVLRSQKLLTLLFGVLISSEPWGLEGEGPERPLGAQIVQLPSSGALVWSK